ncbi:hypothetical protein BH11BAC3_BH11BAC3_03900 [soil metagenome]
MKKQINNLFVNINRETLSSLTTIVNETLAIDVIKGRKSFTPAELWQIQSRKRITSGRRNFI